MMYHALGNCATLADFEAWLEQYPQPWGVEANFGIIDAQGGAAYYEMNNHRWIKYDVNQEPAGYRVVTNFSFAGRYEDYAGWERYLTASSIMKDAFSPTHQMTAYEALNLFSRQYKHELLGVDYSSQNAPQYIVDQDFIPRRITSAVVVFEGVNHQQDARKTLMWTVLGYPTCAVAIPLLVHGAHLPYYMLARDTAAHQANALHSEMCDASLQIKDNWVFPLKISNGKRYLNTQVVLRGVEGKPSLLSCTHKVEQQIIDDFIPLYQQWTEGALSDQVFFKLYDQIAKKWMKTYNSTFKPYL